MLLGAGTVQSSLPTLSLAHYAAPSVLQIETDKVTVDVRAPKAGVVEAILVSVSSAPLPSTLDVLHRPCRRTAWHWHLLAAHVGACSRAKCSRLPAVARQADHMYEPPTSIDGAAHPHVYPACRSSQTTMWRLGMWWRALGRWDPLRLPLRRSPRPHSSRQQHPRHRRRPQRRLARLRPRQRQRQLLRPWHIASQASASPRGARLMVSRSQHCLARKRSG